MSPVVRPTALLIRVAVLAVLSGCRMPVDDGGMSDSTFVAAMAQLQRIATDSLLDATHRAEARSRALQERGLTPAQLERKVRSLAQDPDNGRDLWRAIDSVVRTRSDTVRPPPRLPEAPPSPR